jgi:DNA gyrase subunit A
VEETDGSKQLMLGTRNGMAIRFAESDVRPMGRTAYGVRGMQLREGDEVVAMGVIADDSYVLTVCENGYGKRTEAWSTARRRAGASAQGHPDEPAQWPCHRLACVTDRHEIFVVTEQGQIIRMKAADLRPIGRDTQGVKLMELAEGDKLVSLATLVEPEETNN